MIISFASPETRRIFEGERSRAYPPDIQAVALRKLNQLHAAAALESLRVPPGNRLEALRGNREGQYSIRINDQWRICFVWLPASEDAEGNPVVGGPAQVEIVDYH